MHFYRPSTASKLKVKLGKREVELNSSLRIEEIAKSRGISMAQVVLAWSLSKEFVTAPIVGTTSLDKLRDSVGESSCLLSPSSKHLLIADLIKVRYMSASRKKKSRLSTICTNRERFSALRDIILLICPHVLDGCTSSRRVQLLPYSMYR